MDIVRFSIAKPVTVTVGVILVVMFGLIGLVSIPIQLTPTVDRPVVTVSTTWPGRSPEEVVDEITREQEEELKNVQQLKRMKSISGEGRSEIELEFFVGADIRRALQEVSDALRQVREYPDDVDEPVIKAADGANENAIAWFIIDVDPAVLDRFPGFDIATLFDPLDEQVKPFFERVDGVAEVNIYGGREREARVYADPTALAQRGLNHVDLLNALRGENRTVSAGAIAEGKRDYRVRVIGQYDDPRQILDTVVAYRDGMPVYVRDVATVDIGYQKRRGFVRTLGHPSIAMNVIRQSGANVVEVMQALRDRVARVREEVLPRLPTAEFAEIGPHLRIRQVYDETTYIDSAVGLVTSNLYIGGAIAAAVLIVFLRSIVSTTIISVAIPISVIGTFLVMLALGRTLNIISLAGLSFAVGMVVDNAIVVLENIYRRLQNGDPPARAAYLGGKEVWGAILASTLTTAAVFVPVLTIQEEAGQLFRDLSLAIVASVLLSLVVSVTVIPAACAAFLRPHGRDRTLLGKWWQRGFGADALCGSLTRGIANAVHWSITGWRGWTVRPAIILLMTGASVGGAVLLAPPLDYLPSGNKNLVFGSILIPPGLSVDEMERIAERIEGPSQPYVEATAADPASYQSLPPIARFDRKANKPLEPFDPVPVNHLFIGARGGFMFMGGSSELPEVVVPVGQLMQNAAANLPDAYAFVSQSSIFGRGVGGGNTVNVEITGPAVEPVRRAAAFAMSIAGQRFGFDKVRADPSNFNLLQPEYRLELTDRARELGVRTEDIGIVVRALFDGALVGDYKHLGQSIDLALVPPGGKLETAQALASVPVATPSGRVVPLDTLVSIVPGLGPQDIQRIEEQPAVTILFQPQEGQTVEELEAAVRAEVLAPLQANAELWNPATMAFRLEGTAAKLDEVRTALFGRAPEPGAPTTPVQRIIFGLTAAVALAGVGVAVYAAARAVRRKSPAMAYGAVGALALVLAAGIPMLLLGWQPQLVLARMVWALLVTYLLMCALFESWLYPFVIMFSVPLAVVGGFAGLRLVHVLSLQDPTKAPQNLDVLTMLGFVLLIGVVVNNAIILVYQALNFMRGVGEAEDDKVQALPPLLAIKESVRTRVRPICMTVLTSVGGMLPLVLFPGAGSEMYRGLGSVVVGGLLVSTVFTLVLVPMLFSLALQAVDGLKAVFLNVKTSTSHAGCILDTREASMSFNNRRSTA